VLAKIARIKRKRVLGWLRLNFIVPLLPLKEANRGQVSALKYESIYFS
jgi:hypothetical protein